MCCFVFMGRELKKIFLASGAQLALHCGAILCFQAKIYDAQSTQPYM